MPLIFAVNRKHANFIGNQSLLQFARILHIFNPSTNPVTHWSYGSCCMNGTLSGIPDTRFYRFNLFPLSFLYLISD